MAEKQCLPSVNFHFKTNQHPKQHRLPSIPDFSGIRTRRLQRDSGVEDQLEIEIVAATGSSDDELAGGG